MNRLLLIALGAALGANARYLVGLWTINRFGVSFPYGTLIVNVSGSFVLGFLVALATERLPISMETRLILVVGFLGSFTTFSSFAQESLTLLRDYSLEHGLLNLLANVVLGLLAAVLGSHLGRAIEW